MGGQPGKLKPPGNPPVRPEPQEPKPIEEPPTPIPVPPVERPPEPIRADRLSCPTRSAAPHGCQSHPAKLSLGRRGLLRCARQFLCYFHRRTLNRNAVLVVEADLDLAHLVSLHNGANERGIDEQQPRSECRLKENEHYTTHVSCRLSSATAAWIAAAMVAIRASFAAGLRSKVAPISSAKLFSAASIASAARSVSVFTATLGIIGKGSCGRRYGLPQPPVGPRQSTYGCSRLVRPW